MCQKESKEEMKEMWAKISDAARTMKEEPVLDHEPKPILSRFETLLEADAAQKRPFLNSQERTAVRDVLN